jgi:hypothetical protein
MTEKHPSEMTDSEFATAMQERPWRTAASTAAPISPPTVPVVTTSSTTAPPPPAAPRPVKPALAMSEEAYETARRNRAWRNS